MSDAPGLLAEFKSADAIRAAVRAADKAGYTRFEAFSPFPMPDIATTLGHRPWIIPAIALTAGLMGAAVQYYAQYWMNVADYPINVGGRPLHAWPAFIPATLIVGIMWAAAAALVGMLVLNRLPRLHHPLFDINGFERASQDRFFLFIADSDPQFDPAATKRFLKRQKANSVQEVSS
jgi:hypothetical protein